MWPKPLTVASGGLSATVVATWGCSALLSRALWETGRDFTFFALKEELSKVYGRERFALQPSVENIIVELGGCQVSRNRMGCMKEGNKEGRKDADRQQQLQFRARTLLRQAMHTICL